jgi:hypothetical protein
MIKEGHMGAACAFLDLGYSPEMVKTAFVHQGMSDAEADYLVKEAVGAIAGRVGSFLLGKAVPWIAKLTGGAGGAAAGSLTKGMAGSGGKVLPWMANKLHGLGTAASTSLTNVAQSPFKSIPGGLWNFGKGMFFMGSKAPSLANVAGKGYGMYGMGKMILGPGSTPMPTPQTQQQPGMY